MNPPAPSPGRAAPIIDRAPLAMVELGGPEHRVCAVNDAFCRLLGEARESLLGRPFTELVADGESCAPLIDRVYETGSFEIRAAPATPEESGSIWVYAVWPTLDVEARPIGVIIQLTRIGGGGRREVAEMNEALLIGALRQHELRAEAEAANASLQIEVVERVRVQQALEEAQASLRAEAERLERTVAERTAQLRASVAQLEAFSYSLAHDLRAPVRAIHGFVQFALETPGAEAWEGLEFLHRVSKAAERMEQLIQDVLALNRVASEPIEVASMDVDAMVRALVAESPELGPDRVDLAIEGTLPSMLGHEPTFRQCLANLLGNAVKFVAPGERARVRIRAEAWAGPAGGAVAGAGPRAERLLLWVEDEGIGIPAHQRVRIFELFQRLHPEARYEGTGLGLAIVRKAMHRMGGAVGVEAGAPRGSRFWLELPRGD
jgi:signal transduction histidine kinase